MVACYHCIFCQCLQTTLRYFANQEFNTKNIQMDASQPPVTPKRKKSFAAFQIVDENNCGMLKSLFLIFIASKPYLQWRSRIETKPHTILWITLSASRKECYWAKYNSLVLASDKYSHLKVKQVTQEHI